MHVCVGGAGGEMCVRVLTSCVCAFVCVSVYVDVVCGVSADAFV